MRVGTKVGEGRTRGGDEGVRVGGWRKARLRHTFSDPPFPGLGHF